MLVQAVSHGVGLPGRKSTAQARQIEAAVFTAHAMAQAGLSSMQGVRSDERDAELFDYHFHSTDPADVSQAQAVLSTTSSGLTGDVPIEVEGWAFPWDEAKGVAGYVRGWPLTAVSDIHLLPRFFDLDGDAQAATILHEASHKYAGTADHAYVHQQAYHDLAPREAVSNADTHENYCLAAYTSTREQGQQAEEHAERAAASAHADAIWAAYASGELSLWQGPFTTPDDTNIREEIVADTIYREFTRRRPDAHREVTAAITNGTWQGPYTCEDGTVVDADLFELVGMTERLF